MFSRRTPADRTPNPLARALEVLVGNATPYVDLTESNPTRVGIDYPAGVLEGLGDPAGLRYEPSAFGIAEARGLVAAEVSRRRIRVPPDRIVLTASTSEAYGLLFKLLCDPGDEVLVPRPGYPLFEYLTRLEGVSTAAYDLRYEDRWRLDFESLERAVSGKTRAVLAVSPNNPTGSCLSAEEIRRLGAFCASRSLALVGDEVFADYVIDAGRATTVLKQSEALTFSLGGLSKSAGLPQLKLGWIAAGGPDALVNEALERLAIACDAYLSVATPVQLALPSLLRSGAQIRDGIRARLATNLAALDAALRTHPACRRLASDGGWYAVIQVPRTRSDESLALELLEHERVLVHPGFFFDFPAEGFVVISLLPQPGSFARGMGALLRRAASG